MKTLVETTTVGFVSLGCAKNLIDSEIMMGHLAEAGMTLTPDPELADVLVVNTCSFIDAAKRESIAAIQDAAADREQAGRKGEQKLIVAGCLSQRFKTELPALMPEVDAFIGLDQIKDIAPIINQLLGKYKADGEQGDDLVSVKPVYIPDYDTPRFRLTPDHSAYIKIAEGCNHPCSFCIIPKIRGRHRSRTIESVVKEARQLVANGCKELNLISQDTTYFGMDKWEDARPNPRSPVDSSKGESLATLIRELNQIEGDFWIRLLYTHPAHWSDELMQAIADCDKLARYVDMPLQHISDNMLGLMRRETDSAYIRDLVKRMRATIPDIAIRTTFIVGFPGETEADHAELLEFIETAEFERAGVFEYSKEEGTRAYKMDGHIHHMTRKKRWNSAMAALQRVAEKKNESMKGRQVRVLVEEPGVARTQWDAPDIDGSVFVDKALPMGEFADVTISEWRGYDLVAAQ
ncbi:30S ribosomal protein S12 methylthiotransferase RimO [Cerasicoccus frondis]|uniref:30S ribosomal protein S12 methylthiotransferase RimO n=1 Tax=Cerasicoccus frondis TaxID=490090 RepID=UPI00285291E7|nr:30S ribosomal protein S12 methylthiotransferase RimO [Cerasicoccus frondis]